MRADITNVFSPFVLWFIVTVLSNSFLGVGYFVIWGYTTAVTLSIYSAIYCPTSPCCISCICSFYPNSNSHIGGVICYRLRIYNCLYPINYILIRRTKIPTNCHLITSQSKLHRENYLSEQILLVE